jgi:hypothetical protein
MQSSNGPELRGSTINLDNITAKTDLSNRHTKIVCTLGPACWEVDQLEKLIECGMSVARFNFSHGDHGGHQACLDRLRQAAANKNSHVGEFQNLSITVHFFFTVSFLNLIHELIFVIAITIANAFTFLLQ